MIRKQLFALMLFLGTWVVAYGQKDILPVNDILDRRPGYFMLTGADIYQDYQTVIPHCDLIIRDGKIEAIGTKLQKPTGATVIDLTGETIYPAFIDLYSDYGLPKIVPKSGNPWGEREKIEKQTEGAYNANDAIKAAYNASGEFKYDKKSAETYRDMGFATVLTARRDGLARGSAALVVVGDGEENYNMIVPKSAAEYSWEKGTSKQYYPVSIMGYMAVLRQTFYDADWYAKGGNQSFFDNTLESWNQLMSLPQIFVADNKYGILRANTLGKEFSKNFIMVGGGDEYQLLDEIKSINAPLVVPISFPKAYNFSDPFDIESISLKKLMHWEWAPSNPYLLEKAGVAFAITANGLNDFESFHTNLVKAHRYGVSKETLLKALTYNPAQFIKAEDQVGTLTKNKLANFLVCSGDFFDDESIILSTWVKGKEYRIHNPELADMLGDFQFKLDSLNILMHIKLKAGDKNGLDISFTKSDSTKITSKPEFIQEQIQSILQLDSTGSNYYNIVGWFRNNRWEGRARNATGDWVMWESSRTNGGTGKPKEKSPVLFKPDLSKLPRPFNAYGYLTPPESKTILIKNAMVWTSEAEGVLNNTDVLVENGKIVKVGKGLEDENAGVIDGTGKYLTAGIIDEHSHIALFSINDVDKVSSMVRMKDVINPEDMDIYRQLAGGVTASQLLHGSANPVGGQSAMVKHRWGVAPEEMLVKGAAPFIKFALGENVKKSFNPNSIRYPQTRMGVEQVYRDIFSRAREYQQKMDKYQSLTSKEKAGTIPPRRNLQLEAISEVLDSKRFITCHSYVQSEINMLMKVAEDFGFRVNTFTHILEGYKVADKMKAHGAGASTFSDWWAYKFEVRYAIPYNAAILTREGVVTAINSDDAEMGRRLNQEAAKTMKYGGMSEQQAWDMVTINPAKLLHLDDRMGSIKTGKDADLVLWTDDPLSIYARAEKTWVDGKLYFDQQKDTEMQQWADQERKRIVAEMLKAKEQGEETQEVYPNKKPAVNCDLIGNIN